MERARASPTRRGGRGGGEEGGGGGGEESRRGWTYEAPGVHHHRPAGVRKHPSRSVYARVSARKYTRVLPAARPRNTDTDAYAPEYRVQLRFHASIDTDAHRPILLLFPSSLSLSLSLSPSPCPSLSIVRVYTRAPQPRTTTCT